MLPTNDNNSKTDRNTVAESMSTNDDGAFKPRLIVVSGMMLGLQIELRDEAVTIGRASECALSLQHPSVSRHHCEISRDGNRYFLEDLGSTNRTYLNGKAIRREELHDGDQISVGNNAIKFFTGSSLEVEISRRTDRSCDLRQPYRISTTAAISEPCSTKKSSVRKATCRSAY